MPKTRKRKEQDISAFVESTQTMKAAVFVRYKGLSVKDEHTLRSQLRAEGNTYTAIKKTLLEKALKEAGLDLRDLADSDGSFAVAFGFEDEVSVAKVLHQFGKTNKNIELVGGIYNGNIIQKAEVETLANLPTKEELLAKVLYVIASPLRGLVSVVSGPSRNLVHVLHAIQEQKS